MKLLNLIVLALISTQHIHAQTYAQQTDYPTAGLTVDNPEKNSENYPDYKKAEDSSQPDFDVDAVTSQSHKHSATEGSSAKAKSAAVAPQAAAPVCDSKNKILVNLKVIRRSDGSGNSQFPKGQNGAADPYPTWFDGVLNQASLIRKNSDGTCAVQYILNYYETIDNDNDFNTMGCDIFYKYKKSGERGHFTIVVPSPGSYNDKTKQYYGCTAQTSKGDPILKPLTSLHMDSRNRIAGDIVWELGHNYGYANPGQMQPFEYIDYAIQLEEASKSDPGTGGVGSGEAAEITEDRNIHYRRK